MESVPALLKIAETHSKRGLALFGVVEAEPDPDEGALITKAMNEKGLPFPSYLDAEGQWHDRVGASIIPHFLLVGPKGRLLFRHEDALYQGTPAFEAFNAQIDAALRR